MCLRRRGREEREGGEGGRRRGREEREGGGEGRGRDREEREGGGEGGKRRGREVNVCMFAVWVCVTVEGLTSGLGWYGVGG